MFINVQGTRLAVAHIVSWSDHKLNAGGTPWEGLKVVMTNGAVECFTGMTADEFDQIVSGQK